MYMLYTCNSLSLSLPSSLKDRLRNSPSRDWMHQFVVVDLAHTSSGSCTTELVDSFRYLHPLQEKAYTCWSTLLDSRKINYGTRIDYILVSKSVASSLEKAEVWQEVEGSDHCPVFAEIAVVLLPSQCEPSLSSSNFSAGKQKKLFDFLTQTSGSSSSVRGAVPSAKQSGKRAGSMVDVPSATKVRKIKSGKKVVDSKQSLMSFMKPPRQSEDIAPDNLQETDGDSVESSGESMAASQGSSAEWSQSEGSEGGGKKLSQAWMGVFSGPPKPPLCKGHSEPCVLRTVKKQGLNKNKQFWVCARPGGGKGDPEAKCDFFQWRNAKQKTLSE